MVFSFHHLIKKKINPTISKILGYELINDCSDDDIIMKNLNINEKENVIQVRRVKSNKITSNLTNG
jgi:hypothetical protein